MHTKIFARLRKVSPQQRIGVCVVLLALVVIAVILSNLAHPKRSVTAYCKVYREQTVALGHTGGDEYTYSSALFPEASSNNAADFIPAFKKLDSVAPDEIEPQVRAMKDIFTKMSKEPTQTLSLALNGLPAERAVTQWTTEHCGN
ncbi:MAG TPA: hypothetical protein VJP80_02450 [Candidatus Saccharimonadales bacterium]|nr:hypothetical protein [Candidatus Saccharimonadales bacterium]